MFREMDTADRVGLELLTTEDAASALTKAKTFMLWIDAIKQRLEGELKCDRPVPGWKLVEGRSVRKISDPTAAATLLQQAGYPNDLTHKQSLLGITDLEKLCGKKQLPEILGPLIQKAPGAPTMVAEDDPRKKIESVAAMFGDQKVDQPIF
jgi:hypothetical protein